MNPFIHKTFEPVFKESNLTLIDVGARGGIPKHWLPARKYLNVIGFEPDKLECEKLLLQTTTDAHDKYIPIALSDRHGYKTFFKAKNPGVSSNLRPNMNFLRNFPESDRYETLATMNLEVKPLDAVMVEENIQDADFIKIDVQGSELSVLNGALETLKTPVFGVEVEIEFADIYHNQPLFSEVDRFLRDQGFVLFDLRTVHWKRNSGKYIGGRKGQLVFGDALYLKSCEQFFNESFNRTEKLLKAVSICILYGYYDYALALCELGKEANRLSTLEWSFAYKYLTRPKHLSSLWPWFPGRDRLANLMWLLHDVCRSYYWAHSGSSASGHDMGNAGYPIVRR